VTGTGALNYAQRYQQDGIALMPLPPSIKAWGTNWGGWTLYRDPPMDAEEVTYNFTRWPNSNLAAVTGEPSRNLMILDADSPQAYRETAGRLAGLGIVTLTVKRPDNGSAHDGGAKFLLRTPEPVKTRVLKDLDLEILGNGRYALLPPSKHPQGGTWYFENEAAHIFELPTLGALDWLPLEPAPSQSKALGSRLARGLLYGEPKYINRYKSNSEAEYALCCSLIRTGTMGYTDLLAWMGSGRGPGHFQWHERTKGSQDAERYLQRTWDLAADWVASHPSEAAQLAETLRAWALSQPWGGRSGSTDKAMYLAHLAIVEKCGRDPYHASVRELALLAGIGKGTAARANYRLRDEGLIELVMGATPKLATKYTLVENVRVMGHSTTGGGDVECPITRNLYAHDVFRRGGRKVKGCPGKSGAEVYVVLLERGESHETDLAALTGRHRETVKRALGRMHKLGLAEPTGDRCWRIVDGASLDAAAIKLGTAGTASARRKRYARERQRNTTRLVMASGMAQDGADR